ncbi:N-acetyl-1-D-myo-inositol-2-amino-2-deoxy-alpha-D-glucopyranoside deacetylase [Williamsia sp. Leaf354]|jgi:N-acetyl-1-D-myo-inositol-2-amino-2-deoxy-alpha-D-glucopyranoside deacetylase|uniref:N-acetyl-1-D-myo-inositol-2-amino-2-deoxy-alpha- D-glucopyranoside deacetylase n=1 Tax=Williamsia sp. Leaf354 TaxID=1736349 RepID=UPI0006FC5828|nr:N-acetyl-1-D-myo-inositol-2-amino-2-deoxy-alpha-D-glucopyranoside deacetylase [Williamsia sp. Leaf354]KQR98073.1 N-acetyl-1-D-myo-inositol-2-amino-2-deoxy-alpha-D-glucopyranoside deacetylase [Williamsia sp. Leaf354]
MSTLDRTGQRLLVVHAHPDDESIMTGGIIARYLDEGAEVTVVTCTLGEEGEVIGEQWAMLAADGGADQLGGYRIAELTRALAALSPSGAEPLTPLFLGGAGRWRDSGMAGAPSASHPRAFVGAPIAEPVSALADVIVARRPQVVVGYDPAGTYGHPDHLTVHRICGAAITEARERGWSVAKHYWSVTEASALAQGLDAAVDRVPDGWRMPLHGELPRYRDDEITTAIDVSTVLDRKVDALAAHATQVTVSPSRTEYALSNDILQPIFAEEHLILVDGDLEPTEPGGRENDLFGPSTREA